MCAISCEEEVGRKGGGCFKKREKHVQMLRGEKESGVF